MSSHRWELGLHPRVAGSQGGNGKSLRDKGGPGKDKARGLPRGEDLNVSLHRDSKRTVGGVLWLTSVNLRTWKAGDQVNLSYIAGLSLTWAT